MPLLVSYLALCLGESNESTNVYYISYVCARMPGEWVAHGCVRPTPCEVPSSPQRSTGVVLCGHVRLCRLFAPRSALPRREGTVADPLPPVRRLATPLPTGSPALKKGKRGQGQIPAGSNKDHNSRITAFSGGFGTGLNMAWAVARWRTSPIGRRKS